MHQQSEQERLLKKLLRKSEKKEKKMGNEEEQEDELLSLGFDPREMRAQRFVFGLRTFFFHGNSFLAMFVC